VWADINRIHAVNYAGRHYTTDGPMQVWRSPQGQPVLVQAGSSPQGRDFAARVAEIVFSIQTRFEDAVAYYADIKNRARQHGRDPRHLTILPGLSLVIGSTEAEAFARLSALDELATGRSSIEAFAARLGVDPAGLDPDKPFPEHLLAKLEGAQFKQRSAGVSSGHRAARYRLLQDRSVTVRQIVARGGGGHYRFVGTPEQIVDFMEKWVDEGAADGFNLFMDVYPEGLETFADQVIPLLQNRGRFRRSYEEKTLRERFGFPRPVRVLSPVRGPLPPFCRNSRADGKNDAFEDFVRLMIPELREREAYQSTLRLPPNSLLWRGACRLNQTRLVSPNARARRAGTLRSNYPNVAAAMKISIQSLLEGARNARGAVAVIDTFRALTTAAVALALHINTMTGARP
jgi:alkanesulfonate monooxygenase SsuD/methylene tetrahydromethanopterin reductase-like flavin-dependent oxidoreductase (luciferase family)